MRVWAGMALGVLAGGIALGMLLGTAANPEMKDPPPQPWQAAAYQPAEPEVQYALFGTASPEIAPYRDSYAPTWARGELADWEPEYPEWTYSEFADLPSAEPAAVAEQPVPEPQAVAASPAAPAQPDAPPAQRAPPVPPNLAGLY